MMDPSNKADRYRKEAAKYHELAKSARPAYLGDFYRQVAVRYLFMAEDVSRWPDRRAGAVSNRNGMSRSLTDDEQHKINGAIVEQLKQTNWK
jgi:hypothetical protein